MIRAVATILLAACASEPEPDPEPVFSFAVEVEPHLRACATCHAGATPDGALDLSGDLYDRLLDAPSGQSPLALVEPGDSRASYVWHKLNGTQGLAGGSGTRMPLGDPLPDDVIDAVAEWIDRGAAP
jgi:hypothetical protein